MDKKNLLIGIAFLIGAILSLIFVITEGFKAPIAIGVVLLAGIGIGFIKRSKTH